MRFQWVNWYCLLRVSPRMSTRSLPCSPDLQEPFRVRIFPNLSKNRIIRGLACLGWQDYPRLCSRMSENRTSCQSLLVQEECVVYCTRLRGPGLKSCSGAHCSEVQRYCDRNSIPKILNFHQRCVWSSQIRSQYERIGEKVLLQKF